MIVFPCYSDYLPSEKMVEWEEKVPTLNTAIIVADEKVQQDLLCCDIELAQHPFLNYYFAESQEVLSKAYDVLFQEVIRANNSK